MDAVLTRAARMISNGIGVRLLLIGSGLSDGRSSLDSVLERCSRDGGSENRVCFVSASSSLRSPPLESIVSACKGSSSPFYPPETRTVVVIHSICSNLTVSESREVYKIMDAWPRVSFLATSSETNLYPEILDRFVQVRVPREVPCYSSMVLDCGSGCVKEAAEALISLVASSGMLRPNVYLMACKTLLAHPNTSLSGPTGEAARDVILAIQELSGGDSGYSNLPSPLTAMTLVSLVRRASLGVSISGPSYPRARHEHPFARAFCGPGLRTSTVGTPPFPGPRNGP